MVLNMVVDPKLKNLCVRNMDRQRKRNRIVVIVCPLLVSFPLGDDEINLAIKSCNLVKMSRTIMLFYRSVPFSGAFLLE